VRILQANKYFYLRGGAERYLFELTDLLMHRGHDVIPFSMRDPRNEPTPYSKYFVSPIQTEKVSFNWQGLRTAGRFLYSFEAKKKFRNLVEATAPSLVHLHNLYHQISSSPLEALSRKHLPIVMTLHDYHLLAPNYSLYHDGQICERGIKRPILSAAHRCVKNSVLASLVCGLELAFNRSRRVYERNVKRFLAPSEFVKKLYVSAGFPKKKIITLPLFLNLKKYPLGALTQEAVTYVGRLSQEKGLITLLTAAKQLPKIPFKIIGTGPEENRLRSLCEQWDLTNVSFVGFLDGDRLLEEIRKASLVVAPSEWYETFGLSILEAMALGKTVIASRIGAYPELVREGETGLLFTPGDSNELAQQIKEVLNQPSHLDRMGYRAREIVAEKYNQDLHYARLIEIYQDALRG